MVAPASACPENELLDQLVQGTLAKDVAEAVRDHLDGCAGCRSAVNARARARVARRNPDVDAVAELSTIAGKWSARCETDKPVTLGRYRLDRLVGTGGMGEVWAAHDTELDRAVAVKVMLADLAADSAELSNRMRRESRLMARLSHPAVITVHDVGRDRGRVYIAMELIAGETLGAHLRGARRDWRDIVRWFRAAGAGLAAAHAAGMVHRDFKPENVLCAKEGDRVTRVVVTDFGLARAALADDDPCSGDTSSDNHKAVQLTATGLAIGTPAYMAPEQLAGPRVDARADVFAFAVSLWEALWGARPYPGTTVSEVHAALEVGVLPPPRRVAVAGTHVPVDVPAWLGRALAPALAVDPTVRPPLESLLAAIDPDRRRQRRAMVAAIAAAALVAGGALYAVTRPAAAQAPDPCDASMAALQASWSPDRQAAFAAALERGGVRDDVSGAVDRRVAGWLTTYQQACRAPVSTPARPLQLACLEARRIETMGYIEGVIGVEHSERHAAFLLSTLADPAHCLTPTPESVYAPLPSDPALRARVVALRYQLLDIEEVRHGQSNFSRALALTDQLRPQVAATGWMPLLAELEYLAGASASTGGDSRRAGPLLRRAASLGERSHNDYITAVARLALAHDAALDSRDLDEAERQLESTRAALDRRGVVDQLQTMLDTTRLIVIELRGKLRDNERLIHELLARPGLGIEGEIQVRGQLGDLRHEQTRLREAAAEHRAAIALLEGLGAAGQGNLPAITQRLVDDLVLAGDAASAVAAAERAVAVAVKVMDADHVDHWTPYASLSEAYRIAGRDQEALAAAHRYRTEVVRLSGERSLYAADGMVHEGALLGDAGRFAEALAMLTRACTLLDAQLANGEPGSEVASCEVEVAIVHLRAGHPRTALPILERAIPVIAADAGEDHVDTATARRVLAEALLGVGRAAEAQPMLERARAILAASEIDRGEVADAAYLLSRAVATADRRRARGLAEEAVTLFAGAPPSWARRRAEAMAWRARLH